MFQGTVTDRHEPERLAFGQSIRDNLDSKLWLIGNKIVATDEQGGVIN